jgi:hypothetical protein
MSCLGNLCDSVETKFLLDVTPASVKLKRTLALWANRYCVQQVKLQDYPTAIALLDCAEMLLAHQIDDSESMGLLSSTLVNKAMCCSHIGDIEGACAVLDRAASLDKQAKDIIGSLITRLNKSSMLFKLGAFQESFLTAKEVGVILEPKVNAMIRSSPDPDLSASQKFIDTLSLYLIAQMNVLTAIETQGDKSVKEADTIRGPAVALSTRFFGETHFLTVKLMRSAQNSKRDFRIRTRKGKSWGSDSCDQLSVQDLGGRSSFEETKERSFAWLQNETTTLPSFTLDEAPPKVIVEPVVMKKDRADSSPKDRRVKDQPVKPGVTVRPPPATQPTVQRSQARGKPLKVIRLPNSKLPQIPRRQSWNSHLKFVRQRKLELKDYSFLLDPNLNYVSVPADTQVSKLTTFGLETYVLTCGVSVQQGNLFLVITADLVNSTSSYITPESIQFTELISIINYLAVRDVLPSDVPVKFITSFENFSRYFLLPFIRVTSLEEGSARKKIELWSQPNSLLPAEASRAFLDCTCRVSVYQITQTTLRLVLNELGDEESIDRSLCVDLAFDEEAAGLLLKEYEAKYVSESCLPSLKPLDMSFFKHLDPVITELELYVKDCLHLNATFSKVIKSNLLFKVRASIEGKTFEKTLWTIRDLRSQQVWQIRAKSLAHSNSSGRRNRCEAVINFPYSSISQNYGVHIDLLEHSERLVFAHYTLNSLRLESHADDEACSAESFIVPAGVVSVINKRSMKTADSKVPITLSLIGQGSRLLGVKATLFDVQQCLELGCFFPIFGELFQKKAAKPPEKKKRRFEVMDALLSEAVNGSNIAELLDSESGWGHLLNCVQIAGGKLFIRDLLGRKAYLDSLENLILHYK